MNRRLGLAVVAGAASAGAAIGLTATAAWLIATAATRPPEFTLAVAIVAVRACGVGRGALRYVERLAGHDAVLRRLVAVRAGMMRSLARLAPAGLPELRAGDLTSRVVHDVDSVTERQLHVRLPYLVAAIVGVTAAAGALYLDVPAGVGFAVSLVVAAVVAPLIASRVAGSAEARVAPARGAYAAAVTQTLHGAADIAAFGATGEALARLDAADAAVVAATRRGASGRGVATALAAAAAGGAAWWALRVGSLDAAGPAVPAPHAGLLDPTPHTGALALAGPLLAVLVLAPMAVHDVFAPLAPAAARLPRFRAAAARVAEIGTRVPPVTEPDHPAAPPLGPDFGLSVENLTVGWAPGHSVLRNLSFVVPAGARVAVVGRSGVGKSTLAAALLRFLEPAGGTIRVAGVDIAALAGDDVRRLIGVCAQDAYVFDSTVAENVRLARPGATDAEVVAVLDRAGLGGWLASLPDGTATAVGEHGARLSGGQRQRLALARVLLADQPIVIFDEPTEHLDEASAATLTDDLLGRAGDRTVLLLTHRRHGLNSVDGVITLG